MHIQVSYFAILREQAGKNSEEINTSAKTVLDLYNQLHEQYGFAMPAKYIKFILNDVFHTPETLLKEGDHVIFVAPVSGG